MPPEQPTARDPKVGHGMQRLIALSLAVLLVVTACGDGEEIGVSPIFNGCEAGAGSVVAFLQRSLDDIGTAQPGELADLEERFDFGVSSLLARAQEVHCTEEGFTRAIIARVGELESHGPAGDLLIEEIALIGLGSSDESRGGPLRLPGV